MILALENYNFYSNTVKLGYNKLGYNKLPLVTNKSKWLVWFRLF